MTPVVLRGRRRVAGVVVEGATSGWAERVAPQRHLSARVGEQRVVSGRRVAEIVLMGAVGEARRAAVVDQRGIAIVSGE
jgi:hypothetical protein